MSSTRWLLAQQVLRIIQGFLIGIAVARYLGPEKFGIFSLVVAFFMLSSGIARLGLDDIYAKLLVQSTTEEETLLGTAFWLKFGASICMLSSLYMLFCMQNFEYGYSYFIIIAAIAVVFQSFDVINISFQAKAMGMHVSLCKITQLIASAVIKLYLIYVGAELIWFIYIIMFDTVFLAFICMVVYLNSGSKYFLGSFQFSLAKRMVIEAFPVFLSTFAIVAYMRIDQLMIQYFVGEYQLGLYSSAVKLSEAIYFLPMIICNSFFALILSSKETNTANYHYLFQKLFCGMVLIALLVSLPLALVSTNLINYTFGENFKDAVPVLKIHLAASVFVFLGVASDKYLLAENLNYVIFRKALLGLILNVFLNIWMIPRFGITGAALATLLSQFMITFIYDMIDKNMKPQLSMKIHAVVFPWRIFGK
jgi:O-antigen/teichoic acid export membrane protein